MLSRVPRSRRLLPRALWTAALCAGCAALRAAPLQLPPINTPASSEHHVGKVVWADLVTPDLGAAERFYEGLLGWKFQHLPTGESQYAVAQLGGRPVAGLFRKPAPSGEHRQSAWITFIAVRDVDAARRIAVAHGAKVLSESRDYATRGRQAIFSDPEGAVFAVLGSRTGDAPDFLAEPGEWIWSSLLAREPGAEAAFYQDVFSYDAFDLKSDDGLEHIILSSDDYARASVNSLPGSGNRRPHWLNFIRVENTADTVVRVVELGGKVLVQPHVDRHGGQVAVVADPEGAPFGLMEWTETDTKSEPK